MKLSNGARAFLWDAGSALLLAAACIALIAGAWVAILIHIGHSGC